MVTYSNANMNETTDQLWGVLIYASDGHLPANHKLVSPCCFVMIWNKMSLWLSRKLSNKGNLSWTILRLQTLHHMDVHISSVNIIILITTDHMIIHKNTDPDALWPISLLQLPNQAACSHPSPCFHANPSMHSHTGRKWQFNTSQDSGRSEHKVERDDSHHQKPEQREFDVFVKGTDWNHKFFTL